MKLFDLNGKTAIVTGGYGHLGKAMVEILLALNATVVVAGRSEEKFQGRFSDTDNSRLHFIEADIMSTKSVNLLISNVVGRFKSVDVFVNNAHSAMGRSQDALTDKEWSYTMDGVLGSVHRCIRALIPVFKKQNQGKVINISSMYGVISPDFSLYEGVECGKYLNPPHYGAAKAGIVQLTKYYAVYLAPYNVQVNTVTPGPFPKSTIQKDSPIFIERLKNKNPSKRIGEPEDIKGVIALLSGDGANYITGQNLIVDGGWTIW